MFASCECCIVGPSCIYLQSSDPIVWGTDFIELLYHWVALYVSAKISGDSFASCGFLYFPRGSEVIGICSISFWIHGGCSAHALISTSLFIVMLISLSEIMLRFRPIGRVSPHSLDIHWWQRFKCIPSWGVPSLQWTYVATVTFPINM